jgi:hypothetical protein
MVGHITIDRLSRSITPLTQSEIIDIQQRAMHLDAQRRGEVARDSRGYILPLQAKVKVNGYMSGYVVFFASADGQPQWVDGAPPLWRVTTTFRLRGQKVCDLGSVDVNALTGEVIPLSKEEIIARQNRARYAAEAVTSSAATTR